MTNHRPDDWLDRLLDMPGRGDFTNEIDKLSRGHTSANSTPWGIWQLRDARNSLSELIRRVRHGEAQLITVRGEPAAMLVPVGGNSARQSPRRSLAAVLLSAPHVLTDDEADRLFDRHAANATEGHDES